MKQWIQVASLAVVICGACTGEKRTFYDGVALLASDAGAGGAQESSDTATSMATGDDGGAAEADTHSGVLPPIASGSPTGPGPATASGSGLEAGAACSQAAECGSGHCVDGVCCASACTDVCARCDAASQPGTCVAAESDPECASPTCPADTECRSYAASAGGRCQDVGQCQAGTRCAAVDAPADTPCGKSAEGRCNGAGECVVPNLAALGAACQDGAECGSGFCVNNAQGNRICCDAACDGVCTVCSSEGHCDAAPEEDAACGPLQCGDSTACVTFPPALSAAACASFGQCETAATYCSPDLEPRGTSCGAGKVCDEQGACVVDCPDTSGPSRVCTSDCPCAAAAGVCTSDSDCEAGLVCTSDARTKLGFPGSSCLPAHCVNDKQDATETSVDCGGGCGCRATYEVVALSGVPADASFGGLHAMSGDGSAFAGSISRAGARFSPPYPARIDAQGVVTELPAFGVSGNAFGINADGSVLVGDLWCESPPDCTDPALYRPFKWVDGQAPTAVYRSGSAVAVSSTGAIVAGTIYDPDTGKTTAFRSSGNRSIAIPQLDHVIAISADGEFVAGRSSSADQGALWSATQNDVLPLTVPSSWTHWGITVLSADGSVFAGQAYLNDGSVSFIWQNGTFSDLPKLPGAEYAIIKGMSSDASVLAGLSGTNLLQRAFLWDKANGIRTVLAETAARGLELPVDLELTSVDFLSADGRTLVGRVYGAATPSFWRVKLLP